MLIFIGLGLYDERDVSLKGLEAILTADEVYAEFYTSRLMGASIETLENLYCKKIRLLSRAEVEEDPFWMEGAQEKNLAFLVAGDPMVSTTHLDLRLRAEELGIKTKIIHSSSIITAVSGLTGLQNYRFSRSTTIPFPYISRGKRIVSETPYIVLKENLSRNLHTMFFLDIQNERCMTVKEGVEILFEIGAGERVLDNQLGIGIARAGSEDATIKADVLPNLMRYDFGRPLHILVMPAELHFMEAKALVTLAGAPLEILQNSL